MDKSWIEVEREETVDLFRKKLEALNNLNCDDLDCDDVEMMYKIYKTMWVICQHRKLEQEMTAVSK